MTRNCPEAHGEIFSILLLLYSEPSKWPLPIKIIQACNTLSWEDSAALTALHDDVVDCAHCGMFGYEHGSGGQCLYAPTRYKPICEVPPQPGDTDAEPE